MSWHRRSADGIELFVRLTPKSSADALDGVSRDDGGREYLKARVRAVPEKGAANKALEKLVAAELSLPKSAVSVVAGGTSRLKTLRLSGDPEAILGLLKGLAR